MLTNLLATIVSSTELQIYISIQFDCTGIRALPSIPGASFDNGINSAILRYDGAPNAEPTTSIQTHPIVMNEANLHVSYTYKS